MLFVAHKTAPVIMLLLTEADVNDMRGGRSLFVDEHQLDGRAFTKISLGLFQSEAALKAELRRCGLSFHDDLPEPQPGPKEGRCAGCSGILPATELLGGKCICCWKEGCETYRRMWLESQGGVMP
jgi:hypothetical protein